MRRVPRLALLVSLLSFLAACPSKKPKYPACEGDKDCKPGEKCFNKKCSQCPEDSDCPKGQKCEDGSCEKIEGYCDESTPCPEGLECVDNTCTEKQAAGCASDDDCAEDQDCIKGKCVAAATTGTGDCDVETVYFEYDDYSLTDEAKATLDTGAQCLASQGEKKVDVMGHADNRGTLEYNITLSDKRAQAVINYLKGLKVSKGRLKKVPMGESEATGSDEEGWSRDRRVEFKWK